MLQFSVRKEIQYHFQKVYSCKKEQHRRESLGKIILQSVEQSFLQKASSIWMLFTHTDISYTFCFCYKSPNS